MSETNNPSTLDERAPQPCLTFHQKALPFVVPVAVGVPMLLSAAAILLMLSMHSEREVAGAMTLTPEWVEITPRRPLKPSKSSQEILLAVPTPPGTDDDPLSGFFGPHGAQVLPEIELVDETGQVFPARMGRTAYGEECFFSGSFEDLPKDRRYTKVRLRSDRPLGATKVVWHCYNLK